MLTLVKYSIPSNEVLDTYIFIIIFPLLQVNYLIDEAVNVGKGANAIISMLHYFFATYGLGEKIAHLHADNCSGQNKNRFMVYYLMWRVLTKQHNEITISFLPVGHTKFFPDAGFGMLKRKFRLTNVGCLSDIVDVVNKSAAMNHAQLVGDQTGNVTVASHDWATFFENRVIKSVMKGIKFFSHFRFSSAHPGTVYARKSCDVTDEKKIKLLSDMSWRPSPSDLPNALVPEGLSLKRQWYLYEKIQEFVPCEAQDLVCPLPRKRLSLSQRRR